jgi:hypothetical protein
MMAPAAGTILVGRPVSWLLVRLLLLGGEGFSSGRPQISPFPFSDLCYQVLTAEKLLILPSQPFPP